MRSTLDIEDFSGFKSENDSEVIMSPATRLIAHAEALDAAGAAVRLVRTVPTPLKSIADHAIRSAASVPANLAEGHVR